MTVATAGTLAKDEVPSLLVLPQERVAMRAAAKRGWWARDQRVVGIFVPSHQVVRPERATDGLHPLDAVADDAGVVDDRPAGHHAGAAGPAPVLVGAAAGGRELSPTLDEA